MNGIDIILVYNYDIVYSTYIVESNKSDELFDRYINVYKEQLMGLKIYLYDTNKNKDGIYIKNNLKRSYKNEN